MRDPLLIAGASRPFPGETANGDAWISLCHGSTWLIAVVDGLGHGPEAALAAELARASITSRVSADPLDSLRSCHRALVGTRGAALLLVAIDQAASRLAYAGVGNVEARLWQGSIVHRLVGQRGIIGAVVPTLHPYQVDLSADWLLVIYTDGIGSRFELSPPTARSSEAIGALAQDLLKTWSRPTDDATVVVACA